MMNSLVNFVVDNWLIFALVALIGLVSQNAMFARYRRRKQSRGDNRDGSSCWSPDIREFDRDLNASHLGDPSAQMEFVSRVDFEPRRLLYKSEYRVLLLLESIARQLGSGQRMMAQTNLDEVIGTGTRSRSKKDQNLAFRSINSKRLAFLPIDRSGMLVLAEEYQGHGHDRNKAFMRDAVKREAIRKAESGFWRFLRSSIQRLSRARYTRCCCRAPCHDAHPDAATVEIVDTVAKIQQMRPGSCNTLLSREARRRRWRIP